MAQLQWDDKMELALLTAMLEVVRTDLRAESGFKKDAWKTAVTAVTTHPK